MPLSKEEAIQFLDSIPGISPPSARRALSREESLEFLNSIPKPVSAIEAITQEMEAIKAERRAEPFYKRIPKTIEEKIFKEPVLGVGRLLGLAPAPGELGTPLLRAEREREEAEKRVKEKMKAGKIAVKPGRETIEAAPEGEGMATTAALFPPRLAGGIVSGAYQAVRHPIESFEEEPMRFLDASIIGGLSKGAIMRLSRKAPLPLAAPQARLTYTPPKPIIVPAQKPLAQLVETERKLATEIIEKEAARRLPVISGYPAIPSPPPALERIFTHPSDPVSSIVRLDARTVDPRILRAMELNRPAMRTAVIRKLGSYEETISEPLRTAREIIGKRVPAKASPEIREAEKLVEEISKSTRPPEVPPLRTKETPFPVIRRPLIEEPMPFRAPSRRPPEVSPLKMVEKPFVLEKTIKEISERTGSSVDVLARRVQQARELGIPDRDMAAFIDDALPPRMTISKPAAWGEGFKESAKPYLNFMTRVIKRYAQEGPAGKIIAGRLAVSKLDAVKLEQNLNMGLREIIKGLKKNEVDIFVRAAEGRSLPEGAKITNGMAKRIAQFRLLDDSIQKEAVAMGLQVGYLENHFPRFAHLNKLVKNGQFAKIQDRLIQGALDKKLAANYEEAVDLVYDIRRLFINAADEPFFNPFIEGKGVRKAGMEYSRKIHNQGWIDLLEDVGVYEKNAIARWEIYTRQAARRIEMARQFGAKGEMYSALIKGVGREGDVAWMNKVHDQYVKGVNPTNQAVLAVQRIASNLTGLLTLGLMPLAQAPAFGKLIAVTGYKDFSKGMLAIIKNGKAAKAEAIDAGVLIKDVTQAFMEEPARFPGLSGKIEHVTGRSLNTFLKSNLGQAVDNASRVTAFSVGKFYIPKLWDDFKNMRSLERQGIKMRNARQIEDAAFDFIPNADEILKVRGFDATLTARELERGRTALSNLTAGTASELQLPHFFNSQYGRFYSVLKKTAQQDAAFQWNHIYKPFARGNIKPFVRMLSVLGPMGLGVTYLKDLAFNRDTTDRTMMGWGLQVFMNAQIGGFVADTAFSFFRNNKRELAIPTGFQATMATGRAFVPAPVSIGAEFGAGIVNKAVTGKGKVRLPLTLKVGAEAGKRLGILEEEKQEVGKQRIRERERTRERK